jgi:FtsP/CotA-like multicopper oxidase with cupredoxin domain
VPDDRAVKVSRRSILKLLAVAAMMPVAGAGRAERGRVLRMEVGRQRLISDAHPETEVWGFDGVVPGPELRYRQGERLRVTARNALPGTTTIHWHGLRVPNAMDGVPHLTQAPIPPGGEFAYEFPLHDAGTFWYHPNDHSSEQVARGLYGALIVEEREPIAVDRDVTWVLSDWRLNPDASQREDFGALFDRTHEGRMGNTITINGKFTLKDGVFEVRGGERIRLRLINAASARIFTLRFAGHDPRDDVRGASRTAGEARARARSRVDHQRHRNQGARAPAGAHAQARRALRARDAQRNGMVSPHAPARGRVPRDRPRR